MSAVGKFRETWELTGGQVLAWSLLGRLPAAMCPIGTLLLVSQNTGSVWRGSAVAGALAVGQAGGGPWVGRLADRRGQRPVGLVAATVNALAILALVAASHYGAPLGWQVAPAVLVGLSVPLVGPLSRSRWLWLARGRPERRASALWLDGLLDEASFTSGPAVVGVLATLAGPGAGMLLAAALVGVCSTLFALHPSAPPGSRGSTRSAPAERLLTLPYGLLLAGMALLGVVFGSLQVGVTATTTHLGHPGAAGLLYGLIGLTSSFAGVAVATVPARFDLPGRLRAGTGLLFAASLLAPLIGSSLGGLAVAVGCVGLAVAPQMITMFGLVERTVPGGRLGEAMAGLVSSITLAQAAGTVAAGWAVDASGPSAPFGITCAAAATALLLAACTATGGRYRRTAQSAPVQAVPEGGMTAGHR
ncbi:putative MFS family arabinose efflux permease [Kitasatospora sp. MAP12-15]|uniref:MFS transporter n=1 Tax=unclassified Kitasatospora TaxID=2633591 RepID=UPI0024754C3D|nr:MFS transporter [Kitasatospora sp. MAP12-44]MDH6114035.1 putative MFS family arabinose efflux permease [Kitasatospora sp. MAP12-44]